MMGRKTIERRFADRQRRLEPEAIPLERAGEAGALVSEVGVAVGDEEKRPAGHAP